MTAPLSMSPKALGAFYTPASLADRLAEWAIISGSERVLEPSAGDGALVRACMRQAERVVEAGRARVRVTAVDIDPVACISLRNEFAGEHTIVEGDFLSLSPDNSRKFDRIVANPPFTRNHSIPLDRRKELRESLQIKGAAGLWVHFLLHSLKFLRVGGRLAAVVPAAATFTNYGRDALSRVASQFLHFEVHKVIEMPVWGSVASEKGALIFASGFGMGSSTLPDLSPRQTLAADEALIFPNHPATFQDLLAASTPLNAIASLSIGAVTGANAVFLLTEAERVAAGISKDEVVPIVSRARHAEGIYLSDKRLSHLADLGQQTWLLSPENLIVRGSAVRNRLATIGPKQRQSVAWLNKRHPWWKVAYQPCDAIFTYMNGTGPRLVLAGGQVTCTNTLHHVRFRDGVGIDLQHAAAVSCISTFGQLAAELAGRAYGGGVLKFELKDARALPMLIDSPVSRKDIWTIHKRLVEKDAMGAREAADRLILPRVLGERWEWARNEMLAELSRLRAQRQVQM